MSALSDLVRECAVPLSGSAGDYDKLVERVGDARFVLLGEATHGTHEFYRERAQISKRLIREKGFQAVAVEADWPDSCRINRFVRGTSEDGDAIDALADFERFPQWMWRNADVLDFVGWLRAYNDGKAPSEQVGFYGLDLYSLHASIEAIIQYLNKTDTAAAERARLHYACFDRFDRDPNSYGMASTVGIAPACEEAVLHALEELRGRHPELVMRDGSHAVDEFFCAERNAVAVKNAEQYYRTMFHGEISSWNLRDNHMMDTLQSLIEHLDRHYRAARVIVWAHNSHVGDARATDMGLRGDINIGQLMRQRHPDETVLIGFTTYTGTVTAASAWQEPAERKVVRPAMPQSYENLFHEAELSRFWMDFERHPVLATRLRTPLLERAIGVVYRPESELASHYQRARLSDQFDAVVHFDVTRAVEPLERTVRKTFEVEETFPSGL